MNLVMGYATGYTPEHIKPFIHSLRKYYNGDVILFVDNVNDQDKMDFLRSYNVTIKETQNASLSEILKKRHHSYLEVLTQQSWDAVLISDVRDVVFQGDPFAGRTVNYLEFFNEDKIMEG